jgi:hypothetical protein
MKKFNMIIIVVILAVMLSSCNAITHTVGTGGKGNGKPGQYDASKKQMYLFGGLMPLKKVDSKVLAGGAQNYTVRTTTSFVDGLVNGAASMLLGFRMQTVRVSKGDK